MKQVLSVKAIQQAQRVSSLYTPWQLARYQIATIDLVFRCAIPTHTCQNGCGNKNLIHAIF